MKNKLKIKIDFNDNAPNPYWYLYWIGKIIFENNIFKVKLYFINTSEPNNLCSRFNDKFKEMKIVSVENLSYLTIGTLYDKKNEQIIYPSSYYKESLKMDINFPFEYNRTAKVFPFLDSKYTPLDNQFDFESLKYYFFINRKTTNIYLTTYNLCNYVFFKTSKFVGLLLSEGIHNLFAIEDIRIISSDNKRVGIIKYNNNKLGELDVKPIAPLFFINNNKGIKSLEAIETRIKSFFINNKNNKQVLESGIYLDTDFPFDTNIKFKLQGRTFSDEERKYYMVSNIIEHERSDDIFTVDEIRIEELYPKNSTDERDSLDKIKDYVLDQPTIKNDSISIGNSEGNSHGNIKNQSDGSNDEFGFGIPVKKIIRDTQNKAYDISLIPTDEELSDGTLCTYQPDKESTNLRLNFTKDFKSIEALSRFELIRLSVEKLKQYGLNYNFKNLTKFNISSENIYNIYKSKLMIVCLSYGGNFYYLIELEKGYTGYIYEYNKNKIDPHTLDLFVKFCVDKLTDLKKGEHIWTSIRNFKNDVLNDFSIVIDSPIAHQKEGFRFIDQAVNHMAEKIYERIA